MSRISVASICSRTKVGDLSRNLETLTRWSEKAAHAGADLALFPETFLTGYVAPPKDSCG